MNRVRDFIWRAGFVGILLMVFATNRRLQRDAENVGNELGTIVGERWKADDDRESKLIALTEKLARLTVAMLIVAAATLILAAVTLFK